MSRPQPAVPVEEDGAQRDEGNEVPSSQVSVVRDETGSASHVPADPLTFDPSAPLDWGDLPARTPPVARLDPAETAPPPRARDRLLAASGVASVMLFGGVLIASSVAPSSAETRRTRPHPQVSRPARPSVKPPQPAPAPSPRPDVPAHRDPITRHAEPRRVEPIHIEPSAPSRSLHGAQINLAGVPWAAEANALVGTVTADRGWTALWGQDASVVTGRLTGHRANALEQLDERPGVSRIEVHRGAKRKLTEPHLGLEFYQGRLYLLYLYYGKRQRYGAKRIAKTLTTRYGSPFGSWEEGRRRKCQGWNVGEDTRISVCKLLTPSRKKVTALQLSVYDRGTFTRLLRARSTAFDAASSLERVSYRASFRAFDAALSDCDEILSTLPTFEAARVWRAFLNIGLGRDSQALSDIATALSRAKSYTTLAKAHFARARVLVARGDVQAALSELDQAAALDTWDRQYESYAKRLREGKLMGGLCRKLAAVLEDERREGHYDQRAILRRAGVPDPSTFEACASTERAKDPGWDARVDEMVDRWRSLRAKVAR